MGTYENGGSNVFFTSVSDHGGCDENGFSCLCFVVVLVGCEKAPITAQKLEPLLIQSGDLPSGITGGQVHKKVAGLIGRVPAPNVTIWQEFSALAQPAGGVIVLIYDDQTQRDAAFARVKTEMGSAATTETRLGEQALRRSLAGLGLQAYDVAWVRCRVVVAVRMSAGFNGSLAEDQVVSYAQRLDARLKPVVC